MYVLWPNFGKRGGLVTVVAWDRRLRKILMVAYADEEAFRLTLQTGLATYFSTSRQKLWKKGEESGNVQRVFDVLIDCDGDAVIYVVEQAGFACHTGTVSCFSRSALKGPLQPAPLGGLETLEQREIDVDPRLQPLPRVGDMPAYAVPPGGTYARRFGM